jgi:predicted TIM-barrel fold metal-dependent hydrolase
MASERLSVIDCDGHVVESITELADYMDASIRDQALAPPRNREGVFPSLDGFHHFFRSEDAAHKGRERVTASEYRSGSGEDWVAFLDRADIEQSVMFTTEGLSVGFIQLPQYATKLCRSYNDYIADRYRKVSARLHPMALIPMQDPAAAVAELRRAVRELDLPGAMIPTTGLPLHMGHEFYWPVYEEAASLDCVLGFHGGSNRGIGIDSFTDWTGTHVLHHPLPLMIALTSLICHGVLDRYPDLRLGFFEGGCGWLVCLLDRLERDEQYSKGQARRGLPDYLANGQILIGCEGEDESLAYLVQRVGVEPFAYSSDYPHEVDFVDAQRQIQRAMDRPDLTEGQKAAILGGNARRFYRL